MDDEALEFALAQERVTQTQIDAQYVLADKHAAMRLAVAKEWTSCVLLVTLFAFVFGLVVVFHG